MEIIELYNEDNEKEQYYLIDSFGVDDEDYAVLKPVDSEDEMLYIFKTETRENEEVVFIGIDDEDQLDEIVEIYLELKEEEDNKEGR